MAWGVGLGAAAHPLPAAPMSSEPSPTPSPMSAMPQSASPMSPAPRRVEGDEAPVAHGLDGEARAPLHARVASPGRRPAEAHEGEASAHPVVPTQAARSTKPVRSRSSPENTSSV